MNNRSHPVRTLLLLVPLFLLPGLASAAQVYGWVTLSSGDTFVGVGDSYQSAPTGPLQDERPPVGSPSILPPLYGKYVVDYGAISVYANNDGTAPLAMPPLGIPGSGVNAVAGFQDSFTISSASVPFYSQGSMDIRIDVTGQLLASGSSEANYGVSMQVGGSCCGELYGTRYGADVPGVGGGFYGFGFGSYVFNVPITFGLLDGLVIEGTVNAYDREGPGSAVADLYSTIAWGGVLALYDADGMPVESFQMVSGSGYDYATVQPAIVPLPATVWMLLTGIGALVARRFS